MEIREWIWRFVSPYPFLIMFVIFFASTSIFRSLLTPRQKKQTKKNCFALMSESLSRACAPFPRAIIIFIFHWRCLLTYLLFFSVSMTSFWPFMDQNLNNMIFFHVTRTFTHNRSKERSVNMSINHSSLKQCFVSRNIK